MAEKVATLWRDGVAWPLIAERFGIKVLRAKRLARMVVPREERQARVLEQKVRKRARKARAKGHPWTMYDVIKRSPPSEGQVYVFAARRRLVSAGYLLKGGADMQRVWGGRSRPSGAWVRAELASGGLIYCGKVNGQWLIRPTPRP
jgi:hypothetical protein